MKSVLFVLAALASVALANTAPTVVIQSATMRPGTTLMDVVYRVNDPDDATVKTRALAFVDGVRSFANVIKPVTFVEGTAAKLGDAIPANVDHTLTWDVAADWNIDLGQVKFEVLAMDGRGLLPIDWITIPAAEGKPAVTISKDTPSDASVLDALFWQYADGDPWLNLTDGKLTGNSGSGVFEGAVLVNGSNPFSYTPAYIFKRMNLDLANIEEIKYAVNQARASLLAVSKWHAVQRAYTGISKIVSWGDNWADTTIPAGLIGITAIATGSGSGYGLAFRSDGTAVVWGGQSTMPVGLTNVTGIAAGTAHKLLLKSDGTVVGWGSNTLGETTIPAGLSGVTAIAAGVYHSLALTSDGTVVGWGDDLYGQNSVAAGLSGVTAIAAGSYHSLALTSDGTVVSGGVFYDHDYYGESLRVMITPSGLSGVTAIAAGVYHSLALKSDGTVVGWGDNSNGQTTVPAGLSGVTAIAAGDYHSLALKSDGTVVAWGSNSNGQTTIPAGLSGVTAIAAGGNHSLALKARAP